jgi:hypothetical protein
MKRLGRFMTVMLLAAYVFVPWAIAGEAVRSPGDIPQIVAFDNEDFLGDHIHIFGNMKDLGKWDNSISSMIVLSGTWEFFDDDDFEGSKMATLGPGMYPKITDKGLKDNSVSSIRLTSPGSGASAGTSTR